MRHLRQIAEQLFEARDAPGEPQDPALHAGPCFPGVQLDRAFQSPYFIQKGTMDRILSSTPNAALRPYVRAYAQRQVAATADILQPVVASLEQVLQFDFGDPLLIDYTDGRTEQSSCVATVGAHSFHRASIRFCGQIESFAVFFQPFGFWQLFGLPNRDLRDHAFDGADVLGGGVRKLWLQIAEAPSFERRVEIVERFLMKKADTAVHQTPIMAAAMYIFQNQGRDCIAAVANHSGLGIRQFERRFQADVGISPKLFARISRFQMALDARLHMPARSWLSIAHEFGYHDQMHMHHDFQSLGGSSPTGLVAQLGDTRPAALASSGFSTPDLSEGFLRAAT